jgi:hypothetical protein
MQTLKRTILTTFGCAAWLLSSCATGYQPNSFSGGYSDVKLAPNVAIVNFQGNGYTSDFRAAKLLLLRAADVCLQSGYQYFVISHVKEESTNQGIQMPSYATTSFGGGFANTTFVPGGYVNIHKPAAALTITMSNSQKDPALLNGTRVYQASFLRTSLKADLNVK